MIINVNIADTMDMVDFVNKVSGFVYDIDLKRGSHQVDAKSILGVMYLGTGNNLELEANTDDGEPLKRALQKYIAD